MQILKKKLTGVIGMTAAAVAAGVLTMPGQAHAAEAAFWSVDCDKVAAPGDPGAHNLSARIWRTAEPGKSALAHFQGGPETLSLSNRAGAMMHFTLQWTNAAGNRIERAWELHLGSGETRNEDFNIPEGRTVYVSVGTPGGSTAYCNGKS
ncbi:hypothetical protein [Streptomyces sp. NPDC047315]|uniref:hypothetical protein n=1 Tax=Streptomyces sp. NPDC047315 TaxID=3155142 RepID=UPI0033CD3AAC